MRRLDEIESYKYRFEPKFQESVFWLIARVKRLETALRNARYRHVRLRVGDNTGACDLLAGKGLCNCGALDQARMINEVLQEDGDT